VIRVGLTQRVVVAPTGESRDCLDQRWAGLLESVDAIAVPLPNAVSHPDVHLAASGLDALLLTGGDDLAELSDPAASATRRDAFERAALRWAVDEGIPVLGVCRGFQFVVAASGGILSRRDGHAGTRHGLTWDEPHAGPAEVLSHHHWTIARLPQCFEPMAWAHDGTVEAAQDEERRVFGIMWHPERAAPSEHERALLRTAIEPR
jgi:putative glutamine amidotransferase